MEAKASFDKRIADQLKDIIKDKKDDLKTILKDTGVAYNDDMAALDSSLKAQKSANDASKLYSAGQIRVALAAENDKVLEDAIGDLSTKTPEEIVEILKDSPIKVQGQIAHLNDLNKNIQNNIDQLNKDISVEDVDLNNVPSSYPPTSYVPSDDEIENDPDYQSQINTTLVPTDYKDRIKARKEYLRDKANISRDDDGAHPIIWFKSHFRTKNLDKEMAASNKKELKEKIKQKLIAQRQKDEYEGRVDAQKRKNAFKEEYEVSIINDVLQGKTDEDIIRGTAYQKAADKMEEGR